MKKRRISIGKRPIWLSGIFSQGFYRWDNKAKSSVDDGFQAWLPGQPDNFQNNEECLMMNPKGRWNDVSCNSQAYVICEKCINCPPELLERSALDEGLSKLNRIILKVLLLIKIIF